MSSSQGFSIPFLLLTLGLQVHFYQITQHHIPAHSILHITAMRNSNFIPWGTVYL